MGRRPSHGPWQQVDEPAHPPAFTPAEAAACVPRDRWQRTVRYRQPWQGARALPRRTGTGHGLWPDHQRAPDRRDAGPGAAQARVDLVAGHLLALGARSAPRRGTRSSACATGSSPPTNRSSMRWAGPTTRCGRNGRLCATGSWSCWLFPAVCWWGPCPTAPRGTPLLPADAPARASAGGKPGPAERAGERRRGSAPGNASSGPRRCVGCGGGSAHGRSCSAIGGIGRPPPRRPSWPRSSPTSPSLARFRPRLDQPATSTAATLAFRRPMKSRLAASEMCALPKPSVPRSSWPHGNRPTAKCRCSTRGRYPAPRER